MQVGLAVALRHRRSGRVLVAVTTHLSCNFNEPWTQIAQVQTVLSAAASLAAKHGEHTPGVLGADLNSIPGSGVHHLVAHGLLPASHPHLKIIAEHVEMPELPNGAQPGGGLTGGPGGEVRHPIDFGGRSAYQHVLGQEPLFTNATSTSSSGTFIGCLDYIFASVELTPLQVPERPHSHPHPHPVSLPPCQPATLPPCHLPPCHPVTLSPSPGAQAAH